MTQKKRMSLRKKADTLFSKQVRAAGRCHLCPKTEHLQCAHGFSRRYLATRWDERNAFCLCRGCHLKFTVRPIEWDDFLRKEWGPHLYEELRALARSSFIPDYEAIIQELKEAA